MCNERVNAVAIIPARGGSKRIPRKNIRTFFGKPVIAYSISAALESGLFRQTMVSTDDREIAEIAGRFGAAVPFLRSAGASEDTASTEDVIAEVLTRYREKKIYFDYYGCVYAAAPFVTAELLRRAFEKMTAGGASFLTPVVRYSHPPQRGRVIRNGMLEAAWPEYQSLRTQDLEPLYHDAGQFYFGRTDDFFRYGMAGRNVMPLILSEDQAQDIDTVADWSLAEMKYRLLHSGKGGGVDETLADDR